MENVFMEGNFLLKQITVSSDLKTCKTLDRSMVGSNPACGIDV
jgi:hypothetical protein